MFALGKLAAQLWNNRNSHICYIMRRIMCVCMCMYLMFSTCKSNHNIVWNQHIFYYTVCYVIWRDVCANITFTMCKSQPKSAEQLSHSNVSINVHNWCINRLNYRVFLFNCLIESHNYNDHFPLALSPCICTILWSMLFSFYEASAHLELPCIEWSDCKITFLFFFTSMWTVSIGCVCTFICG